jgi:glycopeptide antibiotics resistance protein
MKYLIDFIALALIYTFVLYKKWKQKGRDILLVRTLFYVYLSLVALVTLMPVITSLPFILNHPYDFMNMVPFIDVLSGRGDFIRQVLLNVIMTVPFGFLYPMTCSPHAGFLKTVLFCFLMSLGIELLQPLIDGFRSADITDLITNTVGGVIGYGIYLVFRPVTSWILERVRK